MTEEVGKVIHDLYEELVEVRKQNVGLTNANKIYSKQNVEFRKNQDQDSLNRELSSAKIGNVLHERTIEDLKMENESYKRQNVELKSKLKESGEFNVGNVNKEVIELRKENVRLVAQLENDEHNVGHLDEKMKRLDYLEKHVAENRYVFTEIPNTPENLKMVKLMKKYINKRKYTMRWRGQYLIDGENWKKYTYGQPLSKSKCIRVYIDSKAYSIDTVEGFNTNEVDTIIDALNCWENELSSDHYKSDTVTQLLNYFESMRLHLENSASKPIKDNVNIVIPKGDKQCHTK